MKLQKYSLENFNFLLLTIAIFTTCLTGIAQNIESENNPEFKYLEFEDDVLKSTHDIKFSLKIPDGFSKINPLNHKATFNDHPFNVSVAALISEKTIIMVHAEKVTDSSGFLDYSYLKPASLSGFDFHIRESCFEINEELLDDAVDVLYFQENGFNFYPAMYLKQYFLNTSDGNSEYVLSYGKRVCDCSDKTISDTFKNDFIRELERTILLTETK